MLIRLSSAAPCNVIELTCRQSYHTMRCCTCLEVTEIDEPSRTFDIRDKDSRVRACKSGWREASSEWLFRLILAYESIMWCFVIFIVVYLNVWSLKRHLNTIWPHSKRNFVAINTWCVGSYVLFRLEANWNDPLQVVKVSL